MSRKARTQGSAGPGRVGRPPVGAHDVPTPDRLLAAAQGLFAARGFAATRLEDVAREAGVSRPSLLHHFASKDALYAAVVGRTFEELGAAMVAAFSREGDFDALVAGATRAYEGFLRAHPAHARLVVRELIEEDGPARTQILAAAEPLLAAAEQFLRSKGRGRSRARVPLRAALMQVVVDSLMRAAVPAPVRSLWGPGEHGVRLARMRFVDQDKGQT